MPHRLLASLKDFALLSELPVRGGSRMFRTIRKSDQKPCVLRVRLGASFLG
jgi:hypothetical protein